MPNLFNIGFTVVLVCALSELGMSQRNNPYSANPLSSVDVDEQPVKKKMQSVVIKVGEQLTTIAQQTAKPARGSLENPKSLSEIYKVGVGDVLFVNLKNAPEAAGYYTVRNDGSIDFPLAGESPVILEKTVDQIERMLASAITLYPNPQIEVRIRAYASHKITVSGMAERIGEKSLQREAMPLFAVRAEALVNPSATKVNIRRGDLEKVETYELSNEKTGEVLVYPGNSVEFIADGQRSILSSGAFFYIAGYVNATGQKQFTDGMTLFQAVTVAGGVKGNPKKATLRRKNDKGNLHVAEYDLRAIRNGKAPDPVLLAGDMIEIDN